MKASERKALTSALGTVLREMRAELRAQIVALDIRLGLAEKRLDAGGGRSLIDAYQGVWKNDRRYARGDLVTDGGGLWFCNTQTNTRPGSGSHWILAVKSGAR
jgi:hypothetical protein